METLHKYLKALSCTHVNLSKNNLFQIADFSCDVLRLDFVIFKGHTKIFGSSHLRVLFNTKETIQDNFTLFL